MLFRFKSSSARQQLLYLTQDNIRIRVENRRKSQFDSPTIIIHLQTNVNDENRIENNRNFKKKNPLKRSGKFRIYEN